MWRKAAFSTVITPHKYSEIILKCWFAAQEIFIIIISVENSWAA